MTHDYGGKSAVRSTVKATGASLDPERKARLKEDLLASAGRSMTVVRHDGKGWQKFLPGVFVRLLHEDKVAGIQTALWRMEPGARIPAHPHQCDEECYLLEGSLEHRDERFEAGDYMLAPAGTRHSTIGSRDGALMLIRGERLSWRDRMMLRAALTLGR